ncbi:MAG: helicase-related protein [Lyngbya sp.]|nr:helicase-related protein [Lyngbya sp.]
MIAEDLGYLFEMGFNIGILAYIQQHNIAHNFGDLYQSDLQSLRFPKLCKAIETKANIINSQDTEIIAKWTAFFIQKGFFSGFNFFREYLESTEWKLSKVEILYYQCNFSDNNSLGTNPKGEQKTYLELLSQFNHQNPNQKLNFSRYQERGEFLRADTLMLLKYRKRYRILCVDLSVFSVRSAEDIKNLDLIEVQTSLLKSEIAYLRSKSVFSGLSIDTGDNCEELGVKFSPQLKDYFTAFKRNDKESSKLIQAASYAYSFSEFLKENQLLNESYSLMFNVFGYTDRGVSAMSVQPDNLGFLKTCAEIYQEHSSDLEITEARRKVLDVIQRKTASSFVNGKKFIKSLLKVVPDESNWVTHHEKIDDFFNIIAEVPPELMNSLGLTGIMNLRQAHSRLIQQALTGSGTYLFLTGNPGIGKTTALVDFLKQHLEEGFLFFYISPRKQVNIDIIEKFKNDKLLCDDRLLCINTNSNLIEENGGRCTVQYCSNHYQGNFQENAVQFVDAQNTEPPQSQHSSRRLQRITEDVIQDVGQKSRGVLYSLCEGLYTIINYNLSNAIVATVSIQSLKKTDNNTDTLRHFANIFKGVYNLRERQVIPSKMRELSRRIKHLFIMIDEITGDDSGAEFLSRISSLVNEYQLTEPQHGFNTKIIVADASIVDKDVINQHLSNSKVQPDKIFFRRSTTSATPLSKQDFIFNNKSAILINANSYPASCLNITYKLLIHSTQFNPNLLRENQHQLLNPVQNQIGLDILELLSQAKTTQIIVYIQDKQRLKLLIEFLEHHLERFEAFTDYIEIHANISESEKPQIQQSKERVKVIFMTASASRGLSFPKTQHILIDIPRFEIEQNLMEIIQVIYRGRGYYVENGTTQTFDNAEKNLIFYGFEQAIYYGDIPDKNNRELSLKESVLNLVNLLMILKTAIMTRIKGAGKIGQDDFMMIPIGGKSVYAAGDTFSGRMASFIRELRKEHHRRRSDKLLLEVSTTLENLLGNVRIVLNDFSPSKPQETDSYLAIRECFPDDFIRLMSRGLHELLTWRFLEPGQISGSLLVVPLASKQVQENYEFDLENLLKSQAMTDLLKKLYTILYNREIYPESLSSATKSAIELIRQLKDQSQQTQWFEQNSQRCDQYYAVPLFIFVCKEALKNYFEKTPEDTDEDTFRDLLAVYIRLLYPADNILPIGNQYGEFPFVVFRSYSLREIRNKIFSDHQLLTSNELNAINLIESENE